MSILVPTSHFVGILSDVYPFASSVRDEPSTNCVQIRWDGEQLHAMAFDRFHLGWSTWDQDDEEPDGKEQPELFETWGGHDKPWQVTISRDDAKKVIDAFKLGSKKKFVALTVEHLGNAVKIVRQKGDDHAAITMVVFENGSAFPSDAIHKMLNQHTDYVPTERLRLNPALLAHFAKVRPLGDFDIKLTGRYEPAIVTIGKRFVGAIAAIKDDEYRAREAEMKKTGAAKDEWDGDPATFLRDATGVHLGGEA